MISEKLKQGIIDQIKAEEHSSRIYMAMASWCETNGYPGAAKFLYTHSDEERMHMLKFVHFLNDRGGHSLLMDLEQPANEFKSLHHVFEEVYKHEQYISARINNLVGMSMEDRDYTTANFLQWFVTEQIEEESVARSILDQFNLTGGEKGSLFLIDKELAAMTLAEAAAEKE